MFATFTRTLICSLLLFVFLVPAGSGQGIIDGFMRGKGNTSAALSYSYEDYDTYFVGGTSTQNANLGTIATRSVTLFAGTGLTDKLDVLVNIPYIKATANQGYWQDQQGLQDGAIYLKYRPLHHTFGEIGEASVIVAGGLSTPLSRYIADAPVAIGHHSTNLDGRVLAQFKSKYGIFLAAQAGYIRRSNTKLDRDATDIPPTQQGYYYGHKTQVPDALDYSAKLGYAGAIYADAWINRQNARGGTNIGPGVPFPSNGVSYTRAGFSLFSQLPFYKAAGLGFGSSYTLNGKNVGKATRYSASLTYNFPNWGGLK
jgi:hypothetical protein